MTTHWCWSTRVVHQQEKCLTFLSKLQVDGAEGGTRTPTSYLTRPSNVRVYQFRHFGSFRWVVNKRKQGATLAYSQIVLRSRISSCQLSANGHLFALRWRGRRR